MNVVATAIETGRCSVAISGALAKDPDVMLALKDRAALMPMTLSGPTSGPLQTVGDKGIARSVATEGGVLVLIEPELADGQGVAGLGKLLNRAGHKPKIIVVARQYNPFAFGALAGFEIEHVKGRGKTFLRDLPMPPEDQAPVEVELAKKVKTKAASTGPKAPRFVFVGRDEEVATLKGFLESGGPIVVSGPHGIGKRSVIEHALQGSGLTRFPDLMLGRGTGFDTLAARLAVILKDGGADPFYKAIKKGEKPVELIAALSASLAATSAEGVMVIEGLHTALGRQADFFSKSRLELLLEVLLTTPSPLRFVFSSLDAPILYREGAGQHLRRLPLEGIKGRFLYEIFEANNAPEFPRDRMGAIADRIEGHPLAARVYAMDVRDRPEGIALTEDPKYLKLDGSLDKVKRRLGKYVEKLDKDTRAALATVAHFDTPVDANQLAAYGINRKTRIDLLATGLLETVGTEEDRKHRIHPLVRGCLTWRETSDFDIYRTMADQAWAELKDSSGLDKLILEQQMNQACINSRQIRRKLKTDLPDNDALVESCIGMIRSKKPNFDLARQRLAEILKEQPNNADAHILQLEQFRAEERFARAGASEDGPRGKKESREAMKEARKASKKSDAEETARFEAVAKDAVEAAPVPEVFHRITEYHLFRRNKGKAIETLEQATAMLPEEARLHCRLGALLLRNGRRKDAITSLETAMRLQPMLPDAYGLLGMARRDEGEAALPEAEALLREAVRLAPEDPVQTARLADLLIHAAAAETDTGKRSDLFAEAKELLELSLRGDQKAPEAQLLLATLHRRSGGDLERAEWLLAQAKKNTDRGADRNHRIALERALVLLAKGQIDEAEALTRGQVTKNPSSHRAVATLAMILEAREQIIPAHAEYMRAKERAPQDSLWAKQYDAELERIKLRIEAGVATLTNPTAPAAAPVEAKDHSEATGNTAHRTIRRKRKGEEDDDTVVNDEPVNDHPVVAAPVEDHPVAEAPVEAVPEGQSEDDELRTDAPADETPQ